MNYYSVVFLFFTVSIWCAPVVKRYSLVSSGGNAVLTNLNENYTVARYPQFWSYTITVDNNGVLSLTDKKPSGHGNVAFINNISNHNGSTITIDYKDGSDTFSSTIGRDQQGNWQSLVDINKNVPWDNAGRMNITVTLPDVSINQQVVGLTKKFTIKSSGGFAVILDERGVPVGDRYPQFRNYDMYINGDGLPYLQDVGMGGSGNVAYIRNIHTILGLPLTLTYKNNSTVFTQQVTKDKTGRWNEWIGFNQIIPWDTAGQIELSVVVPEKSVDDSVLRDFVIKSQSGNAVVYDLATGERTSQTYTHHNHYTLIIEENGAIRCVQKSADIRDVAIIDSIINPYQYDYYIYWLESGQPPVQIKTHDAVYAFNKVVPWDKRAGQGIRIRIYKKESLRVAVTCNGTSECCALPYNMVTSVMTHNAASFKPMGYGIGAAADIAAFFAGHKVLSIHDQLRSPLQQMQDGVRTLQMRLMDWTYDKVTELYACHGLMIDDIPREYQDTLRVVLNFLYARPYHQGCDVDPGRMPLYRILSDVNQFLKDNPSEVMTLVIQQGGSSELLARAFKNAGLEQLLYKHTGVNDPWPTMLELVTMNKRLVLFIDSARSSYPLANSSDDYIVFTQWAFPTVASLKQFNLTKADLFNAEGKDLTHALFTLPNQVTSGIGGDEDLAKQVNAQAVLMARCKAVKERIGKYPNFISLDFYHQPGYDGIKVAQNLTVLTCKEMVKQ